MEQPPTRSYATLQKWSQHFDWDERGEVYDAEQEKRKRDVRQAAVDEAWRTLYGALPKAANVLVKLADIVDQVDDAGTIDNPAQARLAAKDILRYGLGEEGGDDEPGETDTLDWEVFEERIVRYARRYRTGEPDSGREPDMGSGEL